jgi:2-amino-4-hydroxy-6-hydroxymethyldihydropteridine diphosphokinase
MGRPERHSRGAQDPPVCFSKPGGAPEAFVGLGSNLGDTRKVLAAALERLRPWSQSPLRCSSCWRTDPVDCPPDSPPFLNAVVALTPVATETPESLLEKLLALEVEFGRRPKKVPNEPRPLDLDLIAFGDETRASEPLTLPHPRFHQRRFVLAPLSEIAPDLVLPGQERTISQLLAELGAGQPVTRVGVIGG